MISNLSTIISQIYKSRNILLQQLHTNNYNIEEYSGFEIKDINILYKNINKYVTTINTNNFTNLEEFIKIIGRKIKILTLKNQAKTYKNYLENQNLYTDIFNKNPRRITEIENCFSTYQETLSEFEILGDKPNDTEVIIKKKMLYRKNERC